jgi:hypothetical protein
MIKTRGKSTFRSSFSFSIPILRSRPSWDNEGWEDLSPISRFSRGSYTDTGDKIMMCQRRTAFALVASNDTSWEGYCFRESCPDSAEGWAAYDSESDTYCEDEEDEGRKAYEQPLTDRLSDGGTAVDRVSVPTGDNIDVQMDARSYFLATLLQQLDRAEKEWAWLLYQLENLSETKAGLRTSQQLIGTDKS